MKKEIIASANIAAEENADKLVVQYCLLQEDGFSGQSDISYGVELILLKDGKIKENTSLKDVFFSKNEAIDFIGELARGKATPCTLDEIVSDYLKERI